MVNPTISVCIICKDEEKLIKQCLESVKNIADEIIIVDTGSTDNTLEIAKEYTDEIHKVIWEEDFSKARNKALSFATMDWILVIDCDEELYEGITKEEISKYTSVGKYDGYCVRLICKSDNREEEFSLFRLFRNSYKYQYKNRIHEQIIQCLDKSRVGNADIIINHIGYSHEYIVEKDKTERNIKILSSYTDDEKDSFYYYCLGNHYLGENKYGDAINSYLSSLKVLDDPYGFFQTLILNLGKAYYFNGHYDQVVFLGKTFQAFMTDVEEFIRLTMRSQELVNTNKG